jgi:hypothetical protein
MAMSGVRSGGFIPEIGMLDDKSFINSCEVEYLTPTFSKPFPVSSGGNEYEVGSALN